MFPSERTAPRHLSKHLFKISTEYTYELTKRLHLALHELKPKKTTLYSHLLSLLNLQKLIGHLTLNITKRRNTPLCPQRSVLSTEVPYHSLSMRASTL